MAVKALRSIQVGLETTAGTEVNATTILRGTGTIEDKGVPTLADEDVGYMMGTDRTYTPKLEGTLTFECDATYEQLPIILDAGIKTVSPTTTGSGSGYIYTYPFPTTAAGAIKTRTIEAGDDAGDEIMLYSFVSGFKLSGKSGEAIMLSADWVGRDVNPTTATTNATLPTVSTILFGKCYLYIDTAGGTAGATVKSNTLLAFDLDVKTGQTPVYTADGNLYFGFVKQVQPKVELKVTFENDATSIAEHAAMKAETAEQVRLKVVGPALQTTGTAYTTKTMIIDVVGKWTKFDKVGEQNGNDILTGTMAGRYDSTAATAGQILIVNELAALAG